MSDTKTLHAMGKYDAACEILMLARIKGAAPALREIATQVLAHQPDQIHAKWVIENLPKDEVTK